MGTFADVPFDGELGIKAWPTQKNPHNVLVFGPCCVLGVHPASPVPNHCHFSWGRVAVQSRCWFLCQSCSSNDHGASQPAGPPPAFPLLWVGLCRV